MSVAWYIVTESELEDVDIFVDGKAIAHCDEKALARIYKEIGAKPLEEFLSADPAEFDDFLDDFDVAVESTEEQWFEPHEGLASINALIKYLEANQDRLERQDQVLSDLYQYKKVLSQLQERGIRWHLALDF
jgi:hypothetical protein